MTNLKQASRELYRRSPDEIFADLPALQAHCRRERDLSRDYWTPPKRLLFAEEEGQLALDLGDGNELHHLNDWSFGQFCSLAGVSKETVNKVTSDTARRVFDDVLVRQSNGSSKPLQIYANDERRVVKSTHGVGYSRLFDADLLDLLMDQAAEAGFEPPPAGERGGTGLYRGEQDLFVFLIDPAGWTEIGDQAFSPGFFVFNSEVGKRSIGISTFWFQGLCKNHIVWDAVEIIEFTRRHTGKVEQALDEIGRAIADLAAKRDERRDGFAKVIRKAMETKLGDDAEETIQTLVKHGLSRTLAKQAADMTLHSGQGRYSIFSLVDALTRLANKIPNAGDRCEADQKAARLLALAA